MAEITAVQTVAIEKLVPYENNSKIHNKKQLEKLVDSITEFGFISPALIDRDYNIIAGHGRIEAAKIAGLLEVPCVFVEGLTDEQRKTYIIADNRLAEFGEWDKNLVNLELGSLKNINFDINSFKFELPKPRAYYGDERERTGKAYNLNLLEKMDLTDDFWQMPTIYCDDVIPTDLIGFNYAKTSDDKNAGIHFYIDDYQFERIWSYPEKYTDILRQYECILSPDFSLYMDMPMPMKIWNVYRSRAIGAYYQRCGISVIPTISWAEKETYDFCFAGIPKNSIVSVSTVGCKEKQSSIDIWTDGMREMIKRLQPDTILLYGGMIDFDFKKTKVIEYTNKITENWT